MQLIPAVATTPLGRTAMQLRGLCTLTKVKVCFPAWGIKDSDLGAADWAQQNGPTGPLLLFVDGNSVGGSCQQEKNLTGQHLYIAAAPVHFAATPAHSSDCTSCCRSSLALPLFCTSHHHRLLLCAGHNGDRSL